VRIRLHGGPADGRVYDMFELPDVVRLPVAEGYGEARYVRRGIDAILPAGDPEPYFFEPLPEPSRPCPPREFGQR
jgi:hypothetical protein